MLRARSAQQRRTFTALALAPAVLALSTLPGCIAVIGNDGGDYHESAGNRRIRLTSDERSTLPRVSSVADLPRVQSKYASELRGLSPETTLDQFKAAFPTARFVERREINGNTFDAYSVTVEEKFRYRSESYGYLARDEQWFYFKANHFVKTAEPNEWP